MDATINNLKSVDSIPPDKSRSDLGARVRLFDEDGGFITVWIETAGVAEQLVSYAQKTLASLTP